MPNYAHDTERWLRSNAELYRARNNQQMARNFELCADDVKALRSELAAMKAAAMPVVKAWKAKKAFWHERNVSLRGGIILRSGDGTNGTSEHFDNLARLCGEE